MWICGSEVAMLAKRCALITVVPLFKSLDHKQVDDDVSEHRKQLRPTMMLL